MKISIDWSGFQRADDGNTTTYGGSIKVDGKSIRAVGTDRQMVNPHEVEVGEELASKLGIDEDQASALYFELYRHEDGGITTVERKDDKIICENKDNGKMELTIEKDGDLVEY